MGPAMVPVEEVDDEPVRLSREGERGTREPVDDIVTIVRSDQIKSEGPLHYRCPEFRAGEVNTVRVNQRAQSNVQPAPALAHSRIRGGHETDGIASPEIAAHLHCVCDDPKRSPCLKDQAQSSDKRLGDGLRGLESRHVIVHRPRVDLRVIMVKVADETEVKKVGQQSTDSAQHGQQ